MPPRINAAEIRRALTLLTAGEPFEIRIIDAVDGKGWPAVFTGYFDSIDVAVRAIGNLTGWAGVYLTINKINPALLARCKNRLARADRGGTTSDDDIIGRRWMLIDADAKRPAKISATNSEKAAAVVVLNRVVDYLAQNGWPEPVLADSGNGGHALYRIDLPPDDGGLVKRTLEALAQQFDTDAVKVDVSVFNAARICKLPGTLVCKGDSTDDRPHRMAAIISVPETLAVVSRDQLEHIAAQAQPEGQPNNPNASGTAITKSKFDIEAFLAQHEPDSEGPIPYNGGRKWILKCCAFDSSHTGTSVCIIQLANGALDYKCSHNSCRGYDWKEYRALREPAYRDRRESDQQAGATEPCQKRRGSAASKLLQCAHDVDLFHCDDVAYATVRAGEHVETHPVDGRRMRAWLARRFYERNGTAPDGQTMADTLAVLRGRALYGGLERRVGLRVMADGEGAIWLDLADDHWRAVRITRDGWTVESSPTVRFTRRAGMEALPEPVRGGNLDELRPLVNASDDATWIMLVSWPVGALMPRGPYPVLAVSGEQGSTKSTVCKMLRRLIDPQKNDADLRSAPRNERDFAIAAGNSHVVAWDNISAIPAYLSDALCRLATGAGFSVRRLCTDDDETIISGAHPILLNGIGDVVERPDLAERSMIVNLPQLCDSARRTERDLRREYDRIRPRVLGALLDSVVMAMRNMDAVDVPNLPRMADFARWVVAAEPALPWKPGEFLATYAANRQAAESLALDASPIGHYVVRIVDEHDGHWSGTAAELLSALEGLASPAEMKRPDWPIYPRTCRAALDRIGPALRRAAGIIVGHLKVGHDRRRIITLDQTQNAGNRSFASSAPSANGGVDPKTQSTADDVRTVTSRDRPHESHG